MTDSTAGVGLAALRVRWQESWTALQIQARALLACQPGIGAELQAACAEASVEADIVTSVEDARAAATLQSDRYQVLVCEGIDMIPLIEELRNRGDKRPVLFIADASQPAVTRQALAVGASDYLLRPGPFLRTLGSKVRANLDRRVLERITLLMTSDLKGVLEGLDRISHQQMMAELTFSLTESRRLLRRRGSRILVVESDESTRAILSDCASGKNVTVMAGDPSALLETLQVTPVQVVISAVTLPVDMTTPDLVRGILHYDPQVEVVLVANEDEIELAIEGILHGAFDCLARPIFDLELAQKCISRARRSQEQTTLHEHLLGELRRLTQTYAEPRMEADDEYEPEPDDGAERRLEPRTPIEIPVSLWPAGNPSQLLTAVTMDVSLGGVGVASTAVLPVGTPLGLSLELPAEDAARTVIMEGSVAWVALGEEGGKQGFGVRFTRTDAVVSNILAQVIASIRG